MKRVMSLLLGLGLSLAVVGLAQTGGDKRPVKETKKAQKAGKKSKKGSGGTTTPPK